LEIQDIRAEFFVRKTHFEELNICWEIKIRWTTGRQDMRMVVEGPSSGSYTASEDIIMVSGSAITVN
jgi:hypothetical protein